MVLQKGYIERSEELLEHAKKFKKGKRESGYSDDKCLVNKIEDMQSLIGAGARIISLNGQSAENNYISQVEYKGHLFIFVSPDKNPQIFKVEANLRY